MGTPTYSGATYGVTKSLANKTSDYNLGTSNVQMYDNYVDIKYEENENGDNTNSNKFPETYITAAPEKKEENSQYREAYNIAASKLGKNSVFYLGTGVTSYVTDAFISNIEDKAIKSGVTTFRDIVFSGFYQSSASAGSMQELFKGAGKKSMTILEKNTLSKLSIENLKKMPGAFKKNIQDAIKKSSEVYKSIRGSDTESSKRLLDILKRGAETEKLSLKDRLKTSLKQLKQKNKDYKFFDKKYSYYSKAGFAEVDFDNFKIDYLDKTFSASGLSATYGIDVVATFGIEVFSDVIFDDMSFKDAIKKEVVDEGGVNLLGSVWKTTGQIAFQTIGTAVGGPAFGKVCGAAGSLVGKFAGDFTASLLDNDSKACAVTAGTVVGGAVAGSAIGTAIVAAGVCATVPVAGWVIGGCILAGAVVGSAIGVIGHKFKWW